MRIGPFSFEPRLVTTVAAVGFIALTLSLAFWQVDRAEEKSRRQALYDARLADAPVRLTGSVPSPDALLYRQVRASGEWLAEHQVFIDNQIRGARAGFHVVTPLRIEGSRDALLVNRGWIARSRDYPRPPAVAVPQGRVEVSGLATRPPSRYLELSPDTIAGSVWQNLSIERYRSHTGLTVLPIVVLMDSAPPGLSAVREKPDAGIAKHQEYALTWFALAATALVLWVALNLRRIR
ncbi:MAG: SURF1 family protein [Pseudomonadota bacterium]|nr:SURF1 family protein [Pseudomonadota bacterium]